jgi:hypothetical protein
MGKNRFRIDERDADVFRRVCTVMYISTIYALMGVVTYRQFVLDQPQEQWNDMAMIMTINVVVCLGALLYIGGGVSLKRIKLRYITLGYVGFVLLGFAFTVFKYTVLLGEDLSLNQVLDYLLLVAKISGLLLLAWGILAYLGNRRIERQIE